VSCPQITDEKIEKVGQGELTLAFNLSAHCQVLISSIDFSDSDITIMADIQRDGPIKSAQVEALVRN